MAQMIDRTCSEKALQEAHAGLAGVQEGTRAFIGKILRMGVYWPSIHYDATKLTHTCIEYQNFSLVQGVPPTPLTSITSPRSFYQWGIDIVGPFHEASQIPSRSNGLLYKVDRNITTGMHRGKADDQFFVKKTSSQGLEHPKY